MNTLLKLTRIKRLFLALFTLSLLLIVSCRTPQSSRLQVDDFETIAGNMTIKLAESGILHARTPESDPWLITCQAVTNLSDDIMTRGERRMLINAVRSGQDLQNLWDTHQIRFILDADHTRLHRQSGEWELTDAGKDRQVTHVMTAELRNTSRINENEHGRTDMYVIHFALYELASSQIIWSGEELIKRQAIGNLRD